MSTYTTYLKGVVSKFECQNPDACELEHGLENISIDEIKALTAGILSSAATAKGGKVQKDLWARAEEATSEIYRWWVRGIEEQEAIITAIECGALAFVLPIYPSDFMESLEPKRAEMTERADALWSLCEALWVTSDTEPDLVEFMFPKPKPAFRR